MTEDITNEREDQLNELLKKYGVPFKKRFYCRCSYKLNFRKNAFEIAGQEFYALPIV
jgi:hypothetical protein